MTELFVTGTDTGVGKTLVALSLLHFFKNRGKRAQGMKPVAAGTIGTGAAPRNADAVALQQASSVELPYEIVNPYCFREPVAPHIAAAEEQNPIDFGVIHDAYETLRRAADRVVVEGAGGWLVPAGADKTMADLVVELDLKVVLVVGLRLGCLNHSLLTAESITRRGLDLVGWIGCELQPDFPKAEQNIASLRSRLPAPCLGIFSFTENPDAELLQAQIDPSAFA